MRIALIIYGDLGQNSGGYLYDRYLVEFLRKKKHRVDIVSLPWRNYVAHLADNLFRDLPRRIRALKPDLILQDELNHASLIRLNREIKREIPVLSIVHHLRSSEPRSRALNALFRTIEKAYLASVDGFIYNSFTTKRAVVDLLGGSKPNVVAQPGADRLSAQVNPALIRRRAKTPGPLRIIFVGNLILRKAPHLLIEAAASMPRGAVQIELAGGGDFEPSYNGALRRLVSRFALEDHVVFAGHLADHELGRKLHKSHVLVVPSYYEGFGIAYMEGMRFGLPAIGTHSGAAAELITDGRNGYLIEAGNVASLVRRLEYLHKHRNVLVKMSLAARKKASSHPSWQKNMQRVSDFISGYNFISSR